MTTTMHEKFDVLLEKEGDHECEGLGRDKVCVRIVAMAELPTRFGDFHIVALKTIAMEKNMSPSRRVM